MRSFVLFGLLFLSSFCYSGLERPCEIIGYKEVADIAIPHPDTTPAVGLTPRDLEEEGNSLKKCMSKYAVCIVGAPPKKWSWFSEDFKSPINNTLFDIFENHLVFGLIQYVDKEKKYAVCIVATNGLSTVVPWYAVAWIIKGDTIDQYELREESFHSYISPKRLFNVLNESFDETLKYSDPQKTYHISEAIKQ